MWYPLAAGAAWPNRSVEKIITKKAQCCRFQDIPFRYITSNPSLCTSEKPHSILKQLATYSNWAVTVSGSNPDFCKVGPRLNDFRHSDSHHALRPRCLILQPVLRLFIPRNNYSLLNIVPFWKSHSDELPFKPFWPIINTVFASPVFTTNEISETPYWYLFVAIAYSKLPSFPASRHPIQVRSLQDLPWYD